MSTREGSRGTGFEIPIKATLAISTHSSHSGDQTDGQTVGSSYMGAGALNTVPHTYAVAFALGASPQPMQTASEEGWAG